MYRNIIDISKFDEFAPAYSIESYNNLIDFFKKIDISFYNQNKIHVHNHHIIPRSEGGNNSKENLIWLPYRFHIKAHWLRAKEMEQKGDFLSAYKNYKSVRYSIRDSSVPQTIQELELKLDYVIESIKKEKKYQHSFCWVTKNNTTIQVYKNELDNYLKKGWERKRIFKTPLGKIWVTDGVINKYITPDTLETFLKSNPTFTKGFTARVKKSRASYSTLNTKWMRKGKKRKCVKKEDVPNYLNDGWELGSGYSPCKGKTFKWKIKHFWVTNGEYSFLATECPEGFWKGRTLLKKPKKCTKQLNWYTNGQINVRKEQCPEGFWKGRTSGV